MPSIVASAATVAASATFLSLSASNLISFGSAGTPYGSKPEITRDYARLPESAPRTARSLPLVYLRLTHIIASPARAHTGALQGPAAYGASRVHTAGWYHPLRPCHWRRRVGGTHTASTCSRQISSDLVRSRQISSDLARSRQISSDLARSRGSVCVATARAWGRQDAVNAAECVSPLSGAGGEN